MSKDIFPFELVIKNAEGKELFIDTVEKVLQESLQCKDSFGCSIFNCHTHVGSKKHLSKFVEAELLFHNSYYNKGFAFCTVELLKDKIMPFEHIVLVGYETFGELYICETAELLRNKSNKIVEYCIAETIGETFRVRASTEDKTFFENAFFVFVVPINTTLTTHDKLLSGFKKGMHLENVIFDSSNSINIGLIMIASKQENDFWMVTDSKTRKINLLAKKTNELSNIGNREVYFFAKIEGRWYDSEKCELCFPDLKGGALRDEQAIFEVNRASVVPMLQLGTETIAEPLDENRKVKEVQNILKLFILNRYLIHHHLIRNGNHYQYYFDTQKFFQDVKNINGKLGLKAWLEQEVCSALKENNSGGKIIYNFIVAPRHYSNAGFVQYVNNVVFDGSARILYFDVTKEYRKNIKAKYSDLTRLVDNIINSRQPSKLCFHYVDDMILSGSNYLRTKNLLNTLVPMNAKEDLCSRSLFQSVIILVGRNSSDSKRWYAGDEKNFFEYVHLSISPMRNHEDACTLCKMVESYRKLEGFCATNEMSRLIRETIEVHKDMKITDAKSLKQNNQGEKQTRVILSHLLMERLNNHWWMNKENKVVNQENAEDIYCVINDFYNGIYNELRKIIESHKTEIGFQEGEFTEYSDTNFKVALIKVISRPFFCYHIRQKQAALKFCLECLDEKLDKMYKERQMVERKETISEIDKKIIKALANAVADLNAMYPIRADVISRMMYLIRERTALDFRDYCKVIKRNVGMSSDDSKCVLLEHILVEQKESGFFGREQCGGVLSGVQEDDKYALYLENNNVLVEGFRDIVDNNLGFDKIDQIPYYLEKFYRIFEINLKSDVSETANLISVYKEIYKNLKTKEANGQTLRKIAKEVNRLFGETNVKMFFWDKNELMVYDGYYLLGEDRDIDFYSRENLKRLGDALEKEPILDTVYVGTDMCVIKIAQYLESERIEMGREREIYFSFTYDNEIRGEEWFKIKILLTLRSRFVQMLEHMNVQNEMNKLNTERKKKALEIKKAHTHYSLEYFEGTDDIFQYYKQLCMYRDKIALEEGKESSMFSELFISSKQLYDNYVLLLTNEFISDIYRKVIYYPNKFDYKGIRMNGRLSECLKAAGFIEEDGNLGYTIIMPNEYDRNVEVQIHCEVSGFENKKFWFFSRGEALIPYYYYLIMAFAANAGYHYLGEQSCDFFVRADGNYMVFSNEISDYILSEGELDKVERASKQKMETPPWEFEIEKQSITLWSFFRYFQILEKEYERMKESDRGRRCPGEKCFGDGVEVMVNNNKFEIRLKVLENAEVMN